VRIRGISLLRGRRGVSTTAVVDKSAALDTPPFEKGGSKLY